MSKTMQTTRNPYFVILGASLLFDNRFLMLLRHRGMAYLGFYSVSPIFTPFYTFVPLTYSCEERGKA